MLTVFVYAHMLHSLSPLIWVLQSTNGEENWQKKAEHGVFVGCEELFSSPILTSAQDIEVHIERFVLSPSSFILHFLSWHA